jgi:hypothetical protein
MLVNMPEFMKKSFKIVFYSHKIVNFNQKFAGAMVAIFDTTPPKYTFSIKSSMINNNGNFVSGKILINKPLYSVFAAALRIVVPRSFKKEHD